MLMTGIQRTLASAAICVGLLTAMTLGQGTDDAAGAGFDETQSRLRGAIERFAEDYGSLNRFYTARTSANRAERLKRLYRENLAILDGMDFKAFSNEEQVDYVLFRNHLERELAEADRFDLQLKEMADIIPFAGVISDLEDSRRRLDAIDPAKTAAVLTKLDRTINAARTGFEKKSIPKPKATVANRAIGIIASLRVTLRNWYNFHAGYDPLFTWWNSNPFKTADESLQKYSTFVAKELVGISPDDKTTIIGDPIGREALTDELRFEMIPYSPEELVEIANREFAWTEAELKKASRQMGFGDDWKKALEAVKQKYVEPGKQPELIKNLAFEAVDFVEKNKLITIPEVAKESWRMEMMTPERQLVAPFFLGGETILVAYPTDGMTHEQKLMSMRGNNPHFSHATVFHELIPGHHLQGFMTNRFRTYRQLFRTPFWTEGWALYWEFLLWDKGFQKSPEDKIGALFWRAHRAARIIFSLNFHLGKMTPQEAVDFLVDRVGHERDNAAAEVRRSFGGQYAPLYQIAYMMGGLQFYRLHHDLTGSGKMTEMQFHDSILKEGAIPVEMVRAILTKQTLAKDYRANWRFYDLERTASR